MELKNEDNDENSEKEQSSDDNKINNNTIHHDNSIEILEPSNHKNISHFNSYKKK